MNLNLLKGTCPNGPEWVKHKRRCYGFFVNRYDRTTWRKAQDKCRSFVNGDLVSIFSKEENEFIANKILEINPELNGTQYYNPWIGLEIRKCRGGKKRNEKIVNNYHFLGKLILLFSLFTVFYYIIGAFSNRLRQS